MQPNPNQPQSVDAPVNPASTPTFGVVQTLPERPVVMAEAAEPSSRGKLFLPLCIVAALELMVIVGLLVALSAAHTNKTPITGTGGKSVSQDPQPATAIGVQQTNDAVSQDITTLDIDGSFPATSLDDTALSL